MGRNAYLAEGFAFWCPQVPDLPVTVWTQLGYRLGSPDPRCQSCAGSGRRPRTIRLNPDGRYDYWQIRSFCGWFQREADILEREAESYQGLPADPEDEAGTIDALSERLRRALACPIHPLQSASAIITPDQHWNQRLTEHTSAHGEVRDKTWAERALLTLDM